MYPLPAWATELIRGPHKQFGQLRARTATGSTIQLEDSGGLAYRDRTLLPLLSGSTTADGSTPGARRTLTATLAPQPGLWDLLVPVGVELVPTVVLRAPNGNQVVIPQGVFPVDTLRMSYGADGSVSISSCPEFERRLRRSRRRAARMRPRRSSPRIAGPSRRPSEAVVSQSAGWRRAPG